MNPWPTSDIDIPVRLIRADGSVGSTGTYTVSSTGLSATLDPVVLGDGAIDVTNFTTHTVGNRIIGALPNGPLPFTLGPYTFDPGTEASLNVSGAVDFDMGYARGLYPGVTGGNGIANININLADHDTNDLFIEFDARIPTVDKFGLKFIKIFGKGHGGTNYANTTFGLNYTGGDNGNMYTINFGDGVGIENDTQAGLWLDGTHETSIGRSYGTAVVNTPQNKAFGTIDWGEDWHHFKIRCKFNSGTTAENEVADGAYYLEIDGDVYVDASGLFNRHHTNGPIRNIELFGYTHSGGPAFEVNYDNFYLSSRGFM